VSPGGAYHSGKIPEFPNTYEAPKLPNFILLPISITPLVIALTIVQLFRINHIHSTTINPRTSKTPHFQTLKECSYHFRN